MYIHTLMLWSTGNVFFDLYSTLSRFILLLYVLIHPNISLVLLSQLNQVVDSAQIVLPPWPTFAYFSSHIQLEQWLKENRVCSQNVFSIYLKLCQFFPIPFYSELQLSPLVWSPFLWNLESVSSWRQEHPRTPHSDTLHVYWGARGLHGSGFDI